MIKNKSVYFIIITALLSLLPIFFFKIGPVDVDLFKIFLVISSIYYYVTLVLKRKPLTIPRDPIVFILIFMLFYFLLSGFWANNILLTISFSFVYTLFIWFYILVVLYTKTEYDLYRWIYCLPLTIVITIVYNLVKFQRLDTMRRQGGQAIVTVLGVTAEISILPLYFIFLFSKKILHKIFAFVMIFAAFFIIQSRGALIIFFINIFIFIVILFRSRLVTLSEKLRSIKFYAILFSASILVFFIMFYAMPRIITSYTVRLAVFTGKEYSSVGYTQDEVQFLEENERFILWKNALRMIESRIFVGVGFANFREWLLRYSTSPLTARVPHNIYLGIWAETGSIGLSMLLLLIGITIYNYRAVSRQLIKLRERKYFFLVKVLEITFWGLLLHSTLRDTLFEFPLYLFMALGQVCRGVFGRNKYETTDSR